MKVGYILKREIKNIPGLQFPYKIMVNDNEKYHSRQKLENKVLLEYCKAFLNDLPSSKSFRKHRSFSQKKKSKNILLFSQQKNVISSIDTENLPFLGDSSSKKMNKNCSSCQKKLPNILDENIPIKNKINNSNNSKKENRVINSFVFYDRKNVKEKCNNTIQTFKDKKINQNDNFFNSVVNKKNNNKKSKLQNLFEYRIKKKMKNMNNIIDKLNTPIFMYNKIDMN
jgi:hypothetical protein